MSSVASANRPDNNSSRYPDEYCSRHFRFRDLIEAGETWQRTRLSNLPGQIATFEAIARLARDIMDPVVDRFGNIEITYGFASPALTRHIGGRIYPSLDQHAGHELKRDGKPVCERMGQAADFRVNGICSGKLAAWIAANLPFDRLYFYGADRPLHVSVGPDEARSVVAMSAGSSGRLVPRVRSREWLTQEFGRSI